jgi:hypothetical protein
MAYRGASRPGYTHLTELLRSVVDAQTLIEQLSGRSGATGSLR